VKSMLTKKRAVIIGGVVVAVAAAAAVYFVVIPNNYASTYTKNAQTAQAKMAPAMDKVYESFSKPVFTNPDVASVQGKTEIKSTEEAIKDAEAVLKQQQKAATDLKSLPLAKLTGSYKEAEKLQSSEQKYLADARAMLDSYKQLVSFVSTDLDFGDRAEKVGTELESVNADDYDATVKAIEKAHNDIKQIVADYKHITPPASLKEYFDEAMKSNDKFVNSFAMLLDALKTEDEAKLDKATADIDAQIAAEDKRSKELISQLHSTSDLQKSIDHLKSVQRDLNK